MVAIAPRARTGRGHVQGAAWYRRRVAAKRGSSKTGTGGATPAATRGKPQSRLAVTVDGRELPDDEARALWVEFSTYMDHHPNDAAGFAAQRGVESVTPLHRGGRAFLVVVSSPSRQGR